MISTNAVAYLKDDSTLPISYIRNMGSFYEFDIKLDDEIVECLVYIYNQDQEKKNTRPKWLERDLEREEKEGESGYYKKARFDFDRIEINTTIY